MKFDFFLRGQFDSVFYCYLLLAAERDGAVSAGSSSSGRSVSPSPMGNHSELLNSECSECMCVGQSVCICKCVCVCA